MNPLQSANLIYRAVEVNEDEDLFVKQAQDPIGYQNSNATLAAPQSRERAKEHMEYVAKKALLGVVICLPAAAANSKPTPIGSVHLEPVSPRTAHHRHSMIGIDILPEYQGQGHGSEAIRWVVQWGFQIAGLHRISIAAFEYNEGAVRLYERLGFKPEGRLREAIWFNGRFWDDVRLGMLEQEWRAQNLEAK